MVVRKKMFGVSLAFLLGAFCLSPRECYTATLDKVSEVYVEVWDGDYDEVVEEVRLNDEPIPLSGSSSRVQKFRGSKTFSLPMKIFDSYPLEWSLKPVGQNAFWEKDKKRIFRRNLQLYRSDRYVRVIIKGSRVYIRQGKGSFRERSMNREFPDVRLR